MPKAIKQVGGSVRMRRGSQLAADPGGMPAGPSMCSVTCQRSSGPH